MRFVPFAFTIAAYLLLFLQFVCPKGGPRHQQRAILLGACAMLAILWNTITTAIAGTLFGTWNLIHVSLGVFFCYFWFCTFRLGRYAVFHASSTTAHEQSAYLLLVSAIALFLAPFLWRYFTA